MRLEIVVLQGVGGVDAAAVEASADQEHRLIVVAREISTVLTDPAAREIQRRRRSVNLPFLFAPSTLLEFLGRHASSAQVFLELIARLFRAAIEDAQELPREWLGLHG